MTDTEVLCEELDKLVERFKDSGDLNAVNIAAILFATSQAARAGDDYLNLLMRDVEMSAERRLTLMEKRNASPPED